MKLKCLALDDEPLALALLDDFIQKTPFLELQASCDSPVEALKHIHEGNIDVIFSDIEMNDLSGLELARIIAGMEKEKRPVLIFSTAYDQYALQGYKVDAVDYLLKPFSYEDFLKAANKARSIIDRSSSQSVPEKKEDYILFKVEYQYVKVFYNEIIYIEGLKDYVKIHREGGKKPLLSLTSMKSLEERLPENSFMRIHRSYIINLDKISSLDKSSVQLEEISLPVSDSYKDKLQDYLHRGMV